MGIQQSHVRVRSSLLFVSSRTYNRLCVQKYIEHLYLSIPPSASNAASMSLKRSWRSRIVPNPTAVRTYDDGVARRQMVMEGSGKNPDEAARVFFFFFYGGALSMQGVFTRVRGLVSPSQTQ